jgi:Pentapeptide repeats (8 copies)
VELTEQGQVTDRYTKAIEQLGSGKLDVRIGGIYALERIARDSARDHPVIMEVLAAFIREHSDEQWPLPEPGAETPDHATRPDVQAAATVIGRRDVSRDREPANLAGADLTGAHLTSAHLTSADLTGANLTIADLDGAHLSGAHLTSANLTSADLTGADLTGADLTGADVSGADLSGVDLASAHLNGADLSGTRLSGANLSGAHLTGALWPDDAVPPPGWQREPDSGRLRRAGGP